MKNKIVVVTGGAGFIGSNLIRRLIKFKNYEIISLDNYSTGSERNHILNKRVKYINADTNKIEKILSKYRGRIESIFHFGEFARI